MPETPGPQKIKFDARSSNYSIATPCGENRIQVLDVEVVTVHLLTNIKGDLFNSR